MGTIVKTEYKEESIGTGYINDSSFDGLSVEDFMLLDGTEYQVIKKTIKDDGFWIIIVEKV